MFTLVAALIFSGSALFALTTIAWMFATCHRKMAAALLFEPIPQEPQVYHIRIRRPRVRRAEHSLHGAAFGA
ncbi:hypothetical protein [Sphingobium ummariense]|uniref:Uncharacterized protein n=1 Tax=Sphingobium ummariense RL-3 TaxID=1346791 RepID=T0J2B3_9SPHN|nr:hypothetical protein [Sphingobium ummariense]EQB32096.1 hypothetical protein M529_11450 [Sphingobium ummariense RL-3]